MAEQIKELIRKRAIVKGKITIFGNYVTKLKQSIDNQQEITESQIIELHETIVRKEGILNDFDSVQTQIELTVSEDELASQFDQREECQNLFLGHYAMAKCLLNKLRSSNEYNQFVTLSEDGEGENNSRCSSHHSNSNRCSNHSNSPTSPAVKLPDIKLPTYNGAPDTWLEFRDTFHSLINNNSDINDINKFHYLRASLEGTASQVIKSLEFSGSNYQAAWELLCKRFDNKKLLIHNHLEALFNLEKITKASSLKLRKLSDTIAKHLRALQILELPTTKWDILVLHLIAKCLDDATVTKWEEYKSRKDMPSLEDFYEFLKNRADLLERLENNKPDKSNYSAPKSRGLLSANENDNSSENKLQAYKTKCVICNGEHKVYICEKFKSMLVSDRIAQVKKLKLCLNCLRGGHFTKQCRLYASCKKCGYKHNTLLHLNSDSADCKKVEASNPNKSTESVSLTSNVQSCQILLPTAIINVLDKFGKYVSVRAILDSGSMSSYITESLCDKLGIQKQNIEYVVSGLNSTTSKINFRCNIQMKSRYNNFKTDLMCFVLPEITSDLPGCRINIKELSLPQNLQLADDSFHSPGPIDMLIGSDLFWNLLCNRQFSLGANRPVLHETQLGWIISGKVSGAQYLNKTVCNFTRFENENLDIQNQLSKFFELEDVKLASPWSSEEKDCENYFVKTTKRLSDGRFEVSIPLKQPASCLGESLEQAKSRFYSLENKFTKNKVFHELYSNFLKEYEELGHMKLVPCISSDLVTQSYYMPHHGILREHSSSTKLRTVFDASARTSTNISLNDLQMKGPVIQDDLLSILLRFRQHKYVVTADIEKMYRQVLVSADQHSLQRILWRSNQSDNISVFELQTVTYGTTSAPFLAIRCLRELGENCKTELPEVSSLIIHDFYVDDLITGFDDLEKAKIRCLQVKNVLSSGCFSLRKWRTNVPDVLDNLKFDSQAKSSGVLVFSEGDTNNKTLGLIWESKDDKLAFNINVITKQCVTKRIMLSCIAKVFDPLGIVSPCIILAKIMLQQLWQENLSWDTPISNELQCKWNQFISELSYLNDLKINRHVICFNPVRIELHAFSDASNLAYGSCVYIRSENSEGQVFCHLLTSKTKVAPIKPLTTPRLELCAAHVLAKLVNKVVSSLRVRFDSCTYWSDSKIILGWIRTSTNLLKTFVRNRVAEIQDLTEVAHWRYVPTSENPADLLSRGVSPVSLAENCLWWNGPEWLKNDDGLWPIENDSCVNLPEIKTLVTTCQVKFPFERFSRLDKLKRCMAYILRFKENCLVPKEKRYLGVLTASELNRASELLVRLSQMTSFVEDYNNLSLNCPVDRKSKLLNLSPFIDSKGILRVGGRLDNSSLEYDKRHPMLLSSKHHLTKLLFENEHVNLMHAGPQQMLFSVRERFWPIAGRNLAKAVVHKCIKCYRFKAKTVQPIMGNLPANRFMSGFPFQVTGMDYAGPFSILEKRGRGSKLIKGYVCLFICFATKAIHLEFVSNLSTEMFLLALKRFISRRGKPTHLHSDNGSNFVGADRELKQIFQFLCDNERSISDFMNNQGVSFHFNPVHAPHFGGLWEAGVKAMKHHLKRVLNKSNFTAEEFSTLLCQIEAILNSRPISPLSTDPTDPHPLTPAHFIIGRPLTTVLEPDLTLVQESRLSRYQKVENARRHFWARWYKEYISELQIRTKWKANVGRLREGDLVIIKDDKLPPLNWRLGRIVKVMEGIDKVSRVCEIKTSSGTIKRDFSKVCVLPDQ